jgi:sec-independent protein translocase protein TatA
LHLRAERNLSAVHIIMGRIGPTEIILIVALLLLMFGGKKIPELMRGLGRGMKEFKDAQKDDQPSQPEKP